ncbi:MAG: hypothetical protein WHX52_23100 [Anaerolineae bacterium]
MRKRAWMVVLMFGGGLLWGWFHIRLPGEIAVLRRGSLSNHEANAVYLLRPLRLWGGWWKRLTPRDVYAMQPVAWSPDGQWAAFRCAEEIIHRPTRDQCVVFRPGRDELDCGSDDLPDRPFGICLIGRNGDNFRRLVDNVGTATPQISKTLGETRTDEITWTLDGRYIVYMSRGAWYYIDPMAGTTGQWHNELGVQSADYWYFDQPDLHIPKEAIIESGLACGDSCQSEGWSRVRGSPSPSGRYLAFILTGGESDPWYLVGYDTKLEQVLHFGRTAGYWYEDLVWLPEP